MHRSMFSNRHSLLVYLVTTLWIVFMPYTDCRPTSGDTGLPQYSVETMVVVDEMAFNQWLAIQPADQPLEDREASAEEAVWDFVSSTFASANLILQGMEEYGIRLDVRIQDIRIVRGDTVTPSADPTTRTLLDRTALWEFEPWLIRNGLEYDHALLLTGYDLVAPSASAIIEGYAYMGRMCMPDSMSVVENTMNGIAAVVFAHELGHALGAYHDGEPALSDCDPTSGYIMNDNDIGLSKLRWNYSSCAADRILSTLEHLSETFDCLSPGSTWSPPAMPPYLGQLYHADAICRMSFGNHSYACRHLYGLDRHDSICDTLWCVVNSTYCSGKASVDGVACGSGKRCLAGQCVPFDDVPDDVTDTCPLGDVPRPVWHNRTCSDVIASFTHNCLDNWYKVFCCESCEAIHTGSDVCPYGDAYDRCAPFLCGTQWESECCVTCPPAD